jgi:hypothetical protein
MPNDDFLKPYPDTLMLSWVHSALDKPVLWNSWTHFRQSNRLKQNVSNECISKSGASLYTIQLHQNIGPCGMVKWHDEMNDMSVMTQHDKILHWPYPLKLVIQYNTIPGLSSNDYISSWVTGFILCTLNGAHKKIDRGPTEFLNNVLVMQFSFILTQFIITQVTWQQGDQMSLWKNHPKCSPIHFLPELVQNLKCGKK